VKAVHPNTTRWLPIITAELARQGLPFPPELILAVVDVESRGVPGLVNATSGASGLMQVMPIALQSYNNAHAVKFSIGDMRSRENPVAQIRVGCWLLGQFWRRANDYLARRIPAIPMDELAKIADLMYAAGAAAVRKKLDSLPAPSVAGLQVKYPGWNALPHIENVFSRVSTAAINAQGVNQWIATSARSSVLAPTATDWILKAVLGVFVGIAVNWALKQIWRES
jgi:hypothetical protein